MQYALASRPSDAAAIDLVLAAAIRAQPQTHRRSITHHKIMIMDEVKLSLDENKKGAFYISDGTKRVGEMVISIRDNNLTVYHTEVNPESEGKGYAKQMLGAMVDYARKENLKVIPLCQYVHTQFRRHPDEYADIWNKQ